MSDFQRIALAALLWDLSTLVSHLFILWSAWMFWSDKWKKLEKEMIKKDFFE